MFGLRIGAMGRVGSGLTLTQAAANIRNAYSTSPQVWYDPSDFIWNWRRNLLTYSEQFDNAAWTKTATTVTANAIAAPDGSMAADKLIETAATSNHQATQSVTVTQGATYTATIYAKKGEIDVLTIDYAAVLLGTYNLTTGVATIGAGNANSVAVSASMTDEGDGWYRCSATITRAGATLAGDFRFSLRQNTSYAGDGTSGIYLWGAQLDLGTAATPYQRITDGVQDYYQYHPLPTLYQDSAGTTPVTAVGQPVGLMLDKSRGLVLGGELAPNSGGFSSSSGWTAGAGTTIEGGAAVSTSVVAGTSLVTATTALPVVTGRTYQVTITVTSISGGQIRPVVLGNVLTANVITSPGTYTFRVVATSGVAYVQAYVSTLNSVITQFSVRELPGLHASQSTALARPVLSARKNMLVNTETLATQNVTVRAGLHVLSFWGTGTVTLSGVSTSGPLVGTGANDRVSLAFTPTAGTLTLTVTGSVLRAQLEETRE